MEFKHTPGPWVQADFAGPTPHGTAIQSTHDNWLVASCTGYYGRDVAQANARLIAAAPDLLEALELCLHAVELAGWEGDLSAIKARAAIAKATGESA